MSGVICELDACRKVPYVGQMRVSPVNFSLRSTALVFLAALLFAFASALTGAPTAAAAPGDRIGVEYSADGQTWGGPEQIPWSGVAPVPGGPGNVTPVYIRPAEEVPVDAEIYLGRWSITEGSAWFQVDVDGVEGERITLEADGDVGPGVLMNSFSLDAGGSAKIALKVGLPAEETAQGARISPAWTIQFDEAESPQVDDPGSEPVSGSLDLGSLGASEPAGSLGSNGSSQPVGSTVVTGSHFEAGSVFGSSGS